ncbi:sugar transferase [Chitinimonas sp.]|uniref:sugar transferase n=1 Tax=Chitinimonas sp. TaxID=1934313 RepID=UPI0035AF95BB
MNKAYLRVALLRLKRIVDLVLAICALLILSPFMALISILLMMEGGSVCFSHVRVGRAGVTFKCLKFRTMLPNAEARLAEYLASNPGAKLEWEREFKLKHDPRVTRLGNLLRKSSLDELPQLWNVLRGDMSLVGPRPIVNAELRRYGKYLPDYLSVRPGLTGLWQVSGRNKTTYRRRVLLDAYYVRNWSLALDIFILAKTVWVVIRRDGAY